MPRYLCHKETDCGRDCWIIAPRYPRHPLPIRKEPQFLAEHPVVTDIDTMLSEISQTRMKKNGMVPFICGITKGQIHRSGEENSGFQGQGGGRNSEMLAKGYKGTVM